MELTQTQRMEQKLALTQTMRQRLAVLQMPLVDLREYLQDAALSNPLLEAEEPEQEQPAAAPEPEEGAQPEDAGEDWPDADVTVRERADAPGAADPWDGGAPALENLPAPGESFADMLHEQLLRLRWLADDLVPLCDYLIECLNEKGWLDFPLQDIARECGVPAARMEQALYVVQSLQPTGVGARTLQECLVLQLAQSRDFSADTLHLVQEGLPLLAKRDYAGIMALLGCTRARAEAAARAVCALNPVPTRGYGSASPAAYAVPEASVTVQQGNLVLEMNRGFLPALRFQPGTAALLQQSGTAADLAYLKEETAQAKQLLQAVEDRGTTLEKLLRRLVQAQSGHFLRGEPLRAFTMSELAQQTQLNISTVSRALHGKTLSFRGRSVEVKDLFVSAIETAQGAFSSDGVRQKLAQFVRAEDPARPLSDEELRAALAAVQLPVSRRTVAKYREGLGIPSSGARRRGNAAAR